MQAARWAEVLSVTSTLCAPFCVIGKTDNYWCVRDTKLNPHTYANFHISNGASIVFLIGNIESQKIK